MSYSFQHWKPVSCTPLPPLCPSSTPPCSPPNPAGLFSVSIVWFCKADDYKISLFGSRCLRGWWFDILSLSHVSSSLKIPLVGRDHSVSHCSSALLHVIRVIVLPSIIYIAKPGKYMLDKLENMMLYETRWRHVFISKS